MDFKPAARLGSASKLGEAAVLVKDLRLLCTHAVGEFRKLALMAEADGHLRQKLQQVLKLSKEKWDDARDHAMRAVVADNRMRIWYADKANMEVGLLFTCRLGNVDLDRPVGMLLSCFLHNNMFATQCWAYILGAT